MKTRHQFAQELQWKEERVAYWEHHHEILEPSEIYESSIEVTV